jgi:hypothetical protein
MSFNAPAAWGLLGLVVASLVCTPPLIVYTLRTLRQPVSRWRKIVMVGGVVGGLLSYLLPVLAFLKGLGVATGAVH